MSANSDIRLQPGQVVVDAWDLCVDSPDRRKAQTPHRRALVHDFNDGLTLNWNGDYPGGVTIQGIVAIPGPLEITGSVEIQGPTTLSGPVRLENKLEVRQLIVNSVVRAGPQNVPLTIPIDVGSEIAALKQKISTLEQRLATIQDNWRWCKKCQGMFFAGNPTKGICPAGGQHTLEGSGNYHLLF